MIVKRIVFGLIIFQIFISCGITTFYGKAPKSFKKDIESITIFWNAYSTELEIEQDLEKRIIQILHESDYKTYHIVYQTNNNLGFARRIYYIKLFLNSIEKDNFYSKNKSNEKLQELLKSSDFRERWEQLGHKHIERIFEIFPEFYNFNFKKRVDPNSDMEYVYSNLELSFDTSGFLKSKLLLNNIDN